MPDRFPVGVFTKRWLDYDLENLWYGTDGFNAGYSFASVVQLVNNATDGSDLAVYEIVPWVSSYPKLAMWRVEQALAVAFTSNVYPLVDGNPAIPGTVVHSNPDAAFYTSNYYLLLADARPYRRPGGAPIAIISPGRGLSVWPVNSENTPATNAQMLCTFVWGRYS
jgi:hypothetical protein